MVGGRWRQVAPFSPFGNTLSVGATLYREYVKPGELGEKIVSIAFNTILEQPMLKGMEEVIEAAKHPISAGSRVVSSIVGSFVPTLVNDLGNLFDNIRRESWGEGTLQSISAAVRARLPFVRRTLPARTDIFGHVMESRKAASFDPTIGAEAKETKNPMLRELIREGVSIGRPRRKPEENLREYRLRSILTGRMMEAEIGRLMADSRYSRIPGRKAGDDSRRLLILKAANAGRGEINRLVNDERYKAMDADGRVEFLKGILKEAPKGK